MFVHFFMEFLKSKCYDYIRDSFIKRIFPQEGVRMEYMSLVSKIIEAEHSAKDIAREAKERQENLDADLQRDVEQLRSDCFARAKRRIAIVEDTEHSAAAEDMAAWDKRLEQAMAEVETAYATGKSAWADLLFHRIVGE